MNQILDGLSAITNPYDILIASSAGEAFHAMMEIFAGHNIMADRVSEGKLLVRMIANDASEIPQNNQSFQKITVLVGLSFEDPHGSTRTRQIRNAGSVLLVYDVTSHELLEILESLHETLSVIRRHQQLPAVVVGLNAECYDQRQVTYAEGSSFCNRIGGLEFFEISRMEESQITPVFEPLVEHVLLHRSLLEQKSRDLKSITLTPSQDKEFTESPQTLEEKSAEEQIPSEPSGERTSTHIPAESGIDSNLHTTRGRQIPLVEQKASKSCCIIA